MPICGGVEWYCFVRIGLGNCLAEHFHCNKLIACDGEGVLEEIKKSDSSRLSRSFGKFMARKKEETFWEESGQSMGRIVK